MTQKIDKLEAALQEVLGQKIRERKKYLGEVTVEVNKEEYLAVAYILRDHPDLCFEQLIDLCGLDMSAYQDKEWSGSRYSTVLHLLSIKHNWRLRLKVFSNDNLMPVVASVTPVWNSASWFEREAFDMFGIHYEEHEDLRRILTDYGFIGHPMRKDFPVSGTVEMRYDSETKRVIYQPVTIDSREITPRVVREGNYGGLR